MKDATHYCRSKTHERFIRMKDESVFKIFGRDAQYFEVWNVFLNKWDGYCLITFERYCENHKFSSVKKLT